MTPSASRHDHYPRADTSRRASLRRAASDCAARWLAEDARAGGLVAAMAALDGAAPDVVIERLSPWLADSDWLRARLASAGDLLARDGFARPPIPMLGGGEGVGGLVLAERGAIRLSLQIHPFECRAAGAAAALFIPGAAGIRVLVTGGAALRRHRVDVSAGEAVGAFSAATAAPCHNDPPRPLVVGDWLHLDTAREAFTLDGAKGDVLLLALTVQPPSPLPIRTYDVDSGQLIHVSASRRDSSFCTMALALLRTLGRRDAAPLFAAAARGEDFAARWSAMREFVALDPEEARPQLADMAAADPHPELRRAAAATLSLFDRRTEPCPA